jgi:hypothetical protein
VTKIYIPYATTEGQTAKIAEYIVDVIQAHGHEADAVDIKASGDSVPGGYDGVIVGASIHMGKHDKSVSDYVRKNRVRAGAQPDPPRTPRPRPARCRPQAPAAGAAGSVCPLTPLTGLTPARVGHAGQGRTARLLGRNLVPPCVSASRDVRPCSGGRGGRTL